MLSRCPNLKDASGLAGCASLGTLDLSCCPNLKDVSGLAGCAELCMLNLSHCTALVDVTALGRCAKLRKLRIRAFQLSLAGLAGLPVEAEAAGTLTPFRP